MNSNSITDKRDKGKFLFAAGMVLLFFTGFVATLYYINVITKQDELKDALNADVKAQKLALVEALTTTASDLLILSKPFNNVIEIETQSTKSMEDVRHAFGLFCSGRSYYDHMRIISRSGQEVLRVNCEDGVPKTVAASKLQDKSQRYYTRKLMSLDSNQLYISRLDLNKEGHEIEQPGKAVLRLGMPLYLADGELFGAIVINHSLRQLFHLEDVKRTEALYFSGGDNLLVRKLGAEWLRSGSQEERQYREIRQHLGESKGETLVLPIGFVASSTLYPLNELEKLPGIDVVFDRLKNDGKSVSPRWDIIKLIPSEIINQFVHHFLKQLAWIIPIFLLLPLVIVWQWSKGVVRNETMQHLIDETEFRLNAIMNNVADGVVILDNNGKIIQKNSKFSQMFGYEKASKSIDNFYQLISSVEANRLSELFHYIGEGKEYYRV